MTNKPKCPACAIEDIITSHVESVLSAYGSKHGWSAMFFPLYSENLKTTNVFIYKPNGIIEV